MTLGEVTAETFLSGRWLDQRAGVRSTPASRFGFNPISVYFTRTYRSIVISKHNIRVNYIEFLNSLKRKNTHVT